MPELYETVGRWDLAEFVKIGKLAYDGLGKNLPKLTMQRDADTKTCFLANSEVTVRDINNGDNIVNFACEATDPEHDNIFWSADFDAVNGGYSPSNDALYTGQVINQMYKQWYGVPPLVRDDKPMVLNMRVHMYDDNAYWDGESMTFGDGISMFYPLCHLVLQGTR